MIRSTVGFQNQTVLFLGIVLLITVLCYLPGIGGPFVFDDEPNITKNVAVQIDRLSVDTLTAAALSYGGGQRPLSMLSVAMNHAFSGLAPLPYKIANLSIHLINGLLLFALVRLLFQTHRVAARLGQDASRTDWIALLVTAAWLLHPINVTSVLYVIQRMTSLSALFCLAGMLLYTWGRLRLNRGERGGAVLILAAVFAATPLAYLSKEIGILLPGYLFLIEWLLFGFETTSRRDQRGLIALFAAIIGLPALVAAGFLLTHSDWITNGYANRPFTLVERLLTECRVLWLYLKLLILPRPSELTLFHDDIALSTGLTAPWTTLPALLGLAGLAVGALLARWRWPLAAFGVLFFLGGHLLESGPLPLEIAHEHRNYLPGIGILLAFTSVAVGWRHNVRGIPLGGAIMVTLILSFGIQTTLRASTWSSPYDLAVAGVTDHPQSNRWRHEMGRVFWIAHESVSDPEERTRLHSAAREQFLAAARLSRFYAPGNLLSLLQIDSAADQPTDQRVVTELLSLLPQGPVAPFTSTSMVNLLECLAGSYCIRPIQEAQQLLAALLANNNLSPKVRGQLLAAASQYAANRLGLDQALIYTRAAVEADPAELQHALNYAQILILAGQMDPAAAELRRVKEGDTLNVYREKRERLESQIPAYRSEVGTDQK